MSLISLHLSCWKANGVGEQFLFSAIISPGLSQKFIDKDCVLLAA